MVGEGSYAGHPKAKPQLRQQSRHQLFPQVLQLTRAYIRHKVDFRDLPPQELGLQRYAQLVVERLLTAIRPDDSQAEPPLTPILNRYVPFGSTAEVDFKTTRICHSTVHSHVNQMPMDTAVWESSAAFYVEMAVAAGVAHSYARNEGLHFTIPYDYYGISHAFEPDFLVKLMRDPQDAAQDVTLILEIKGYETDQDRAKHQAAQRWVKAVNNWGQMGRWAFHVSRDPQLLLRELQHIRRQSLPGMSAPVTAEPIAKEASVTIPVMRPETLPQEWLDSIKVAPESKPFLLRCHQAGVPLPEVGYETRDRRRHQAELAWETLNVAVFLPGFEQDKPAFEQANWRVFTLDEADKALATLQEAIDG